MIESDVIWRGDRRHVISDLSLRDSFRRRSLPAAQSLLVLDWIPRCVFVRHEVCLAEMLFDRHKPRFLSRWVKFRGSNHAYPVNADTHYI
jgi:hypothetical protein